jgi:two-component system sensor histidine kinase/response regulator
LELIYELHPDVPNTLVGDVGRLNQILVNLIGNAIKFTSHGEVVVRVERESQTQDTVQLHIAVSDTGISIAEEQRDLIFEAFTQADGSLVTRHSLRESR